MRQYPRPRRPIDPRVNLLEETQYMLHQREMLRSYENSVWDHLSQVRKEKEARDKAAAKIIKEHRHLIRKLKNLKEDLMRVELQAKESDRGMIKVLEDMDALTMQEETLWGMAEQADWMYAIWGEVMTTKQKELEELDKSWSQTVDSVRRKHVRFCSK